MTFTCTHWAASLFMGVAIACWMPRTATSSKATCQPSRERTRPITSRCRLILVPAIRDWHYIVFSGLTAESIVIEAWPNSSLGILSVHFPWENFMAPVNAVQLVSRPSVVLSVTAPIITVPPQSQVVVAGSSPDLPSGSPPVQPPLTYQWQFNGFGP